MIANNIFRIIGELFTEGLFIPFDLIRSDENWWTSNIINFLFIGVFFVLLGYWMKESVRFKKEGTEDLPKQSFLLGSKNKLKRFNENETFSNVIQPTREEVTTNFPHKGKWNEFFKNDNPIILELGCGKGEYTIALAEKNPNINYIGIDIKGARFWRGAKTAL